VAGKEEEEEEGEQLYILIMEFHVKGILMHNLTGMLRLYSICFSRGASEKGHKCAVSCRAERHPLIRRDPKEPEEPEKREERNKERKNECQLLEKQ
jgi:hypothetical protein